MRRSHHWPQASSMARYTSSGAAPPSEEPSGQRTCPRVPRMRSTFAGDHCTFL